MRPISITAPEHRLCNQIAISSTVSSSSSPQCNRFAGFQARFWLNKPVSLTKSKDTEFKKSPLTINMSSDTLSIIGATENPPDVNGLPSNFFSIMDITKDYSGTRRRKTGGKTIYTCTACPDKRYDHKSNAVNHVRNNHSVASRSTKSVSGTQRSISAHFRPVASEDALRNAFNPQAYQESLISMLTRRRVPFSAIEWDEFKQLALACNPYITDSLIASRRTMVRYIAANYDFYSCEIKDSLTTASSPIHISTDLWTSPHRHSLLAVCAQWVDKDYKLQKALLSLPECAESHSGEAQAQAVIDTLEKYGVQSKLGWHTGDNATSNDTCLESLQRKLMSRHKVSELPSLGYRLTLGRLNSMPKDVVYAVSRILLIYPFKPSFSHLLKRLLSQHSRRHPVSPERSFSPSFLRS